MAANNEKPANGKRKHNAIFPQNQGSEIFILGRPPFGKRKKMFSQLSFRNVQVTSWLGNRIQPLI
jgi:hypothetical protein